MDLKNLSTEIDLSSALNRLCYDESLLVELLDTLLGEFKTEQNELLKHARQKNYQWLVAKAHYYKGVAANLDFLDFLKAATALENSANSANSSSCNEAIDKLIAASSRLDTLLTEISRT